MIKRFIIFSCYFLPFLVQANTFWQPVAPGIEYTMITSSDKTLSHLHAFRIDLHKNQLKLAFSDENFLGMSNVSWLAEQHHALLAVNGGFFTPLRQPIGLRIQAGQIKYALHSTSWWSIFYIKNKQPHIINQNDYRRDPNMTFAIQSGPRLLTHNQIPSLKPGNAQRTAMGITPEGYVILVATERWAMSTHDLAVQLKTLGCVDAMSLDGGSSTQLYANMGNFKRDVGSLALIADSVYVVPR